MICDIFSPEFEQCTFSWFPIWENLDGQLHNVVFTNLGYDELWPTWTSLQAPVAHSLVLPARRRGRYERKKLGNSGLVDGGLVGDYEKVMMMECMKYHYSHIWLWGWRCFYHTVQEVVVLVEKLEGCNEASAVCWLRDLCHHNHRHRHLYHHHGDYDNSNSQDDENYYV